MTKTWDSNGEVLPLVGLPDGPWEKGVKTQPSGRSGRYVLLGFAWQAGMKEAKRGEKTK